MFNNKFISSSLIFLSLIFFIPGVIRAEPLDNWYWRNPLPEGNILRVSFVKDVFMALGQFGAIYTSSYGISWTRRESGLNAQLMGAAYGNGTFVALAGNGTIITSPDGNRWTVRRVGTSDNLSGIVFANNTFVVVGFNGAVLTSTDGITWTARTSGTTALQSEPLFSAHMGISPSALDFGSVSMGSVGAEYLTVSNAGTGALFISRSP